MKVTGREFRFGIHLPPVNRGDKDIIMVKEQVHYEDGSIRPNIRYVQDFKRPFWVTKPNYRNHKEKKEWEDLDKLTQYEARECDLSDMVAKIAGVRGNKVQLKDINYQFPYVYGCDISATSLIHQLYRDKYPSTFSPYTICVFDVETDCLCGKEIQNCEIIIATVAFNNQVYTGVLKRIVKDYANPDQLIAKRRDYLLKEYIEKRNIQSKVEFFDSEIALVRAIMRQVHQWRPDFFVIWGITFDMARLEDACRRAGLHPKDLFSDPSVPRNRRVYRFKKGKDKRVTASGKVEPISPADQWHSIYCSSSFFVIDAMCVYKEIRSQFPDEVNYKLDTILELELGIRKLKFKEAEMYEGTLEWHRYMQRYHPVEYVVYNMFDCISIQELDEKTSDLSYKLPTFAINTDFANYKSSTKRTTDHLYFYCLTQGKVIGSQAREPSNKDDAEEEINHVLSLKKWIVTLKPTYLIGEGAHCIEENPRLETNVRKGVIDSDAISAYPSDIEACNVSKETTRREIIDIEGITEDTFRLQNIGALAGHTNAIEYCTYMFGFPNLTELDELYEKEIG